MGFCGTPRCLHTAEVTGSIPACLAPFNCVTEDLVAGLTQKISLSPDDDVLASAPTVGGVHLKDAHMPVRES